LFGAKPANAKFATKTAKEKTCEYCHSLSKTIQKKLKRLKFFSEISRIDEGNEHSPSEFYYREDLETFDVETKTGITECHVIDNLPRSVLPPYFARSVLPGPRANIPQYGPSKLG